MEDAESIHQGERVIVDRRTAAGVVLPSWALVAFVALVLASLVVNAATLTNTDNEFDRATERTAADLEARAMESQELLDKIDEGVDTVAQAGACLLVAVFILPEVRVTFDDADVEAACGLPAGLMAETRRQLTGG